MSNSTSPYTTEFYEDTASDESAEHIFANLPAILSPASVADFGCGQGYWLGTAKDWGATELHGFDGDWVDQSQLHCPTINYQVADFSNTMPTLDRRFDMAISVEVAEHLPADKAEDFVKLLCDASDTVLFSAAIKHQGGNSHVNEQWQAYWIELFKQHGYSCFDVIRPKIWDNENVLWWYRQNIFLFVNDKNKTINRTILHAEQPYPVNLVHPKNYNLKIEYYENLINEYDALLTNPSLGFCINNIKSYFKHFLSKPSANMKTN